MVRFPAARTLERKSIVPVTRGRRGNREHLSGQLRNRLQGPGFVGEFAFLELAVDQLAVHGQLETAAIGGLKLECGDFLLEAGKQLRRQTDGLGLVVSLAAVAQMDFHPCPPETKGL